MPLIALGIGAGAGLLKSQLVDVPKANRQRTLAAATQRYSPWTGLQAKPVQEADPFSSALQFGATGAAMGAGMKSAAAQNDLNQALAARLNTGGSLDLGGANLVGAGAANPWSLSNAPQSPANFWATNPYSS